MKRKFKFFIVSSFIGGLIWFIEGICLLLLNNDFIIALISGLIGGTASGGIFYLISSSSFQRKKIHSWLGVVTSIILIFYFFLFFRHLLSITSGEVALSSLIFTLNFALFLIFEIFLFLK